MKKFLKTCLCLFVVLTSGLIFAGCKGGNEPPEKKDVTVTVTTGSDEVYAYGNLPAISASAKAGSENVSGTIVWNANQTITTSKTSYDWTFTPSDTSKYNVATGSKILTVKKSTPAASSTEIVVDASEGLNQNSLTFSFNGKPVAGTVTFDEVSFSESDILLGTKKQVSYVFTPTDTANFNSVNETVLVSAKVKPTFLSAVPDAMAMTSISSLEDNIASSFTYGASQVAGVCKISETELVAGKNTLHFTFTPTENRYLEVSGEVSVVAFNRENATYLIENAEQLMMIAGALSNQDFKLAKDITLTESDYESLIVCGDDRTTKVVASGYFSGNFDGNGKTISLDSSLAESRVALFDKIENANVSNLDVSGTGEVVLVVTVSGTSMATINNVTMNGKVTNPTLAYAPFVSHITGTQNVMFNGCTNNVEIESHGTVSGFVLEIQNATMVMFIDCVNNANLSGQGVGIFVGKTTETLANDNMRCSNCVNNADVKASTFATLFGEFDTTLSDSTDGIFENNGTIEIYGEMYKAGIVLDESQLKISGFYDIPTQIKVVSTVFVKDKTTGRVFELSQEFCSVDITDEILDENVIRITNLAKVGSLENIKIGQASDKLLNLTAGNPNNETESFYILGIGSSIGYAQSDLVVDETATPFIMVYCFYENGTVLSSEKISLIG